MCWPPERKQPELVPEQRPGGESQATPARALGLQAARPQPTEVKAVAARGQAVRKAAAVPHEWPSGLEVWIAIF